jgi:hypothetical protein
VGIIEGQFVFELGESVMETGEIEGVEAGDCDATVGWYDGTEVGVIDFNFEGSEVSTFDGEELGLQDGVCENSSAMGLIVGKQLGTVAGC